MAFNPLRNEADAFKVVVIVGAVAVLIAGVVLLGIANIRAFRGHYGPEAKDHLGVEVPGIYWHFVDVMWIIVFTTVYVL